MPNGIYSGRGDTDHNPAALTITNANAGNGRIEGGSYKYAGREYSVWGTFYYSDTSNPASPARFILSAHPSDGSGLDLQMSLSSADRNYNKLTGSATVVRTGFSYDISLSKQ
ncbi:hypothetical protein ACYZTX_27695 [Pseudomonas sp. MDT1-17]